MRALACFLVLSGLLLDITAEPSVAGTLPSPVYPDCGAPSTAAPPKTFYVDPVNGSMSGDGSAAHPWQTLAQVVAAGLFTTSPTVGPVTRSPKAVIAPGDTVYLMSGNHGAVKFQGSINGALVGYNNSRFITIAALPGQTPTLTQLSILGASHFIFRGLTFQSLNTSGVYPTGTSTAPDFFLVQMTGAHDNIILDSNTLLSTPNVSGWKIGDWMTKRSSGIQDIGGKCINITNNYIYNIGFGIETQSSYGVLIQSNTVDYFSDDGIDYGSNDTIIQNNLIENSIEDGDGYHRDGMQGQPDGQNVMISNVIINNNMVIRIADPKLPFPGYLQGIDTYDGRWKALTVTNNIVITDASNGIVYLGVAGAQISNNILIQDGGKVLPCGHLTFAQCLSEPVTYDTSVVPALKIGASKTNVPSSSVTVTDNVVTTLAIDKTTTNPSVNHNLCLLTAGACTLGVPFHNTTLWVSTPGSYANYNVIPTFGASAFFSTIDNVNMIYNFKPVLPNPSQ